MEYSKPIKVPDGRYFVKVSKDKERVFFQLNKSVLDGDSLSTGRFKVTSTSQGIIKAVEDDIVEQALKSREEWFGRALKDATIKKAFQSSLEEDVITTTLATAKGKSIVSVYGADKAPLTAEDVKKDSSIDILVELAGVWFLQSAFGVIFRVIQVRVSAAKKTALTTYLFSDAQDDEDDEDEDGPEDYLKTNA